METERRNLNMAPEINRRIAKKLLIAAAALALLGVGHWIVIQNKIMSCTAVADGVITEVTEKKALNGEVRYKWKVAYKAEDGSEHSLGSKKTDIFSSVGNNVSVYYDPHKPGTAFLGADPPDGGLAEFVGSGLFLLSAVVCLSIKPRQKKTPSDAD